MSEPSKLTMYIGDMDAPALRLRLRAMAEWVRVCLRDQTAPNYTVECRAAEGWTEIRMGTREWAIGYAQALDSCTDGVDRYRVMAPSGYCCWPPEAEGWADDPTR